ncbi:MAG: MFS transporter [Nitriliruptoraceae bacterium]
MRIDPTSWPVIWIGVVAVLVTLGFGVVPPALPQFAAHYELTNAGAGLLLAGFSGGMFVFSLPGGLIADRIGLRLTAYLGCAFAFVGAAVGITLPGFWILVASQALQGAGSTLYMTAGLAAIVARTDEERIGRTTTTFQGVNVIGMAFAPLVGGVSVALLGLRGPFIASAVAAIVGFVITIAVVKDTERSVEDTADTTTTPASKRALIVAFLKNRAAILALVMSFIAYVAIGGGRSTLLPLFGDAGLGMSPVAIGWLLSIALVGSVIVVPHAGRSIDHGRRRVAIASIVLFAIAMVLAGFSTAAWMLLVASLITGMAKGYSAAAPVAIITDVADKRIFGSVIGFQRTAASLGLVVGPYLAGLLADLWGFRAAFLAIAAILAVTAAALGTMPETLHSRTAPSPRADDSGNGESTIDESGDAAPA